MAFDVTEFLAIAKKLQFDTGTSSKDEATIRTTAGRMYYAAYLATRESLRVVSGDPTYDINHSALVQLLERQKDATVAAVGGMLRELMKQRKRADYHPDRILDYRAVGMKLKDATEVLDSQPMLRAKLKKGDLPRSEPVS